MLYGTRLSDLRSEECTEIGLVNRNMWSNRGEEALLGWGVKNWHYYVTLTSIATLLQNRDNSGLLGTPLYCGLKLGGGGGGGAAAPPAPPCAWSPPCLMPYHEFIPLLVYTCGNSTACLATKQEACCSPLLHLASLLPPPPLTHRWRKLAQQTQNTLISMKEATN